MPDQTEHPTTFTFIASTGDADRNGNVLDITGWDLRNYRANPVVLFNHNWDLPPVGKATITAEPNRLLAKIEFAPTPLGRELALLNADGYLRAISVAARPLEWEVRRHPEHGFPIGIHSHRQELLELSIVAVPANPATVQAALSSTSPPAEAMLAYLENGRPARFDRSANFSAFPPQTTPAAILEAIANNLRATAKE